jgi:hypothetical protein
MSALPGGIPESIPVAVTAGDIARVIRRELGAQLDAIERRLAAIEEILASSKDTKPTSAKR